MKHWPKMTREIELLSRDIQRQGRSLTRTPLFTMLVVLSLGVGAGTNFAVFRSVDAVVLRKLPVPKPDDLFILERQAPDGERSFTYSLQQFERLERDTGGTCKLLAYVGMPQVKVERLGDYEIRNGVLVSAGYFSVLGARPIVGRLPASSTLGSDSAFMAISYRFWRDRFGSSQDIVGTSVSINKQAFVISAVMDESFRGFSVDSPADFWMTITPTSHLLPGMKWLADPNAMRLGIAGRVNENHSYEAAKAAVSLRMAQVMTVWSATASSQDKEMLTHSHFDLASGVRGVSPLRARYARSLILAQGVVGCVLLVACLNVACLLVARAARQRRSVGIRLALGARYRDLIRYFVAEAIILSALSILTGLVIAKGLTALARFLLTQGPERALLNVEGGPWLLWFPLLTAALCVCACACGPAFVVRRVDLNSIAKDGSTCSDSQHLRTGGALVVCQFAMCIVLVFLAHLFVGTSQRLNKLDLGVDLGRLISLEVSARPNNGSAASFSAMYADVVAELENLPGVGMVSAATDGPFDLPAQDTVLLEAGGGHFLRGESVGTKAVSPRYFATVGAELSLGREFTALDGAQSPARVLVNDAFVRRYTGDQLPIGRRVKLEGRPDKVFEIVGVVRDMRGGNLREAAQPVVFTSLLQEELESMSIQVRATQSNDLVMDRIQRHSMPRYVVSGIDSVARQVARAFSQERLVAWVAGALGMVAVVLSCVGLYGTMSYSVISRTKEIGIRSALGADRRDVVWLILREAALLFLVGAFIGVPAAIGCGIAVSAMLYGMDPWSPINMAATVSALALVVLFAALVPAMRAAQADPLTSLRVQ